ncbi:MAG: hypothetical protein ACP5TV_02990 [Anaerolineae bacterium]
MMHILQLLAALILCWWLPGFFLANLLWPGEEGISIPGRMVLSCALSAVMTSLVGLALAGLHWLSAGPAWGTMLAVTGALAGIWVARRPARPRLVWGRRSTITALFLLVMLAAVLAPRLYLAFGPNPMPLEPDSWAYMADTMRLISARSIPDTVYQWGMETPFPTDKLLFQLFCAVFTLLSGLDALGVMIWVTLLYTATAVVALWLWLREFVSVPTASALATLAFYDREIGYGLISNRFGEEFFRAEGFALMLGFTALWLAGRGRRDWRLVAVLLAVSALSHAVAALVTAVFIAALFAGGWVIRRRLPRDELAALAKIAGGAIAATALLYLLVRGIPQPRFASVLANSEGYREYAGRDLSYLLRLRLTGREDGPYLHLRPKSVQRFYEPPDRLFELLLRRSFPQTLAQGHGQVGVILFFVGALLLCAVPAVPASSRGAAAGLLTAFAGLYGMGLFFAWRYENYALALHGANREFPYGGLCVMVLAGILAEGGWRVCRRACRRAWPWGYAALWAGLWLALLVPGCRNILNAYASHGDLNSDGIRALQWVAASTPADAVLLANRRTAGSIELLAGRRCITEGRGAYLHPAVLTQILKVMDEAECFFHDPACAGILIEHEVDYVLFAPAQSIGGNLPNFAQGVRRSQLKNVPYLWRAARFGSVYIYQVDHSQLLAETAAR